VATIGFGLAAGFRVDAGRDTGCKRQMRLSRLGTDSSLLPDYQGFRDSVRVGPIDPRGGSAEQLAAHQPIGVVRRPFREPPLTAESGGATRAALLAMRAHRGTGSSNPLPSSRESGELYRHSGGIEEIAMVGSARWPIGERRGMIGSSEPIGLRA
jgi:hypothetical protein